MSASSWGSVRKIRTLTQIADLIDFAVKFDGRRFSYDDVAEMIRVERAGTEAKRLLLMQAGTRKALKKPGLGEKKIYSSLAKDRTAFARGTGIFEVKEGRVVCPQEIRKLQNHTIENPVESRHALMKLVMGSTYKTYLYFIKRLQELGGHFNIPFTYRQRSKETGIQEYLPEKGFNTDPASFYTTRDLLYDFGLINWRQREEDLQEHIYLASSLGRSNENHKEYRSSIQLNEHQIYFDRQITEEAFLENLSKLYLMLTGGRWGVIAELIELRDRTSEELCISDSDFNGLILLLHREQGGKVRIDLSHGTLVFKRYTGMLTKALSLPLLYEGKYAVYVRMSRVI